MNTACPSPINRDTFNEAWNYTDGLRRRAKKKYVTSKIASFFSNMVFAVLSFVAGIGLVHDHMEGSYCDFLETVPFLLPTWEKYSTLFLKPDQSPTVQIILTLLVIYGLCFAVSVLFALLTMAVYHPLKKKLPGASARENAEKLLALAKDSRRYALRGGARVSAFWALIFMAAVFTLTAMYWLLVLGDVSAMIAATSGLIIEKLAPEFAIVAQDVGLFMFFMMLFFIGIYLFYWALASLHKLSVQFFYNFKVPYSFVAQIECYSIFADENTADLSQEEVAQMHRDQAADKRLQALELEKIGAHGKAKALLAEAAHGGDIEAMEHYARHWLIANAKDPARYWLECCVNSGQASDEALKLYKRLKWHRRIQVQYLKEGT